MCVETSDGYCSHCPTMEVEFLALVPPQKQTACSLLLLKKKKKKKNGSRFSLLYLLNKKFLCFHEFMARKKLLAIFTFLKRHNVQLKPIRNNYMCLNYRKCVQEELLLKSLWHLTLGAPDWAPC